MNLGSPPDAYSKQDQAALRRSLEQADRLYHKRGMDVELSEGRLIGRSPDGTRFALVFNNDGTLGTQAL